MAVPSRWLKAMDTYCVNGAVRDDDGDDDGNDETPPTSKISAPQKKYFRQRAHANPLSDPTFPYPLTPHHVDWNSLYPQYFPVNSQHSINDDIGKSMCICPEGKRHVNYLDVGCGYGGLTVEVARLFPDKLVMGMEIRSKVCMFVHERIQALRNEHSGQYQNAAVCRVNAMKDLPNYIYKSSLEKMFFLYPDPHFKKSNHRRRIISDNMLDEYAYVLKSGGVLYTVTDVKDLHDWMKDKLNSHPMFVPYTEEQYRDDPLSEVVMNITEEAQKVARNKGSKFRAIYVRK